MMKTVLLVLAMAACVCAAAVARSSSMPRFTPATVGLKMTPTAAPPHQPPSMSMMNPGKYAWEYPTENSIEASPVLANCSGTPCFLMGDYSAEVHALNANTGKQAGIWKKPFQAGEMIRSTIAVSADGASFYFLDGDSKLYSVDVNTGSKKWIFNTSAHPQSFGCSSPVIVTTTAGSLDTNDAVLIVGSVDSYVYAVNASTGQQIWKFQTGHSIYASPVTTLDRTTAGTVFIGSDDGIMYAISIATGQKLWQYQAGDMIRSGSSIWNGVLYFGCNAGVMYALDIKDGSEKFRFITQSYITSIPLVEELAPQVGVVYIGSYDKSMYAVNATSGSKLWSYAIQDSIMAPAALFTPSSTNRVTLYFGGADSYFYAVDARTGALQWKFNVNAPVWSRGVIAPNADVVFGAQLDPDFGGQCGAWAVHTQ